MFALAVLKIIAVLSSGFYFHGFIYMSEIEHPARRNLPITAFLMQWRQSFDIAKMFFVPVEVVVMISTLLLYFMDPIEQASLWLICPTCILAVMVWSITNIIPDLQRTISDDVLENKGPQWIITTVDSIMKRHYLRTALSLVVHLTVLLLSC
ncbi:uncharacterized protein LOC123532344 [Mercenaria mercenaria]|uniref:uncharacterized protein LOC123532344 n=1 Tax=Mercenaria mercenaria TaxID=6596 RepID=UPI00234EB0E0|nr:uncharacterized protein LOC123532344 [Mercenaria mercenaria]